MDSSTGSCFLWFPSERKTEIIVWEKTDYWMSVFLILERDGGEKEGRKVVFMSWMNATKAVRRGESGFHKPKKSNKKGAHHYTADTIFLIY
ncbi:Uncharacterised protein [Mycobacteroides abscessus subsp. abscessus]|nr:Uncharacterised protein [Mycobacteroides abscessus subsp. abscessus]